MDRREWLRLLSRISVSSMLSFLGLSLLYKTQWRNPAPLRQSSEPAVLRPPGAVSEADFLARCIRCQRCQDACSKGSIRLAGPADDTYQGTPFIAAAENACNMCLRCTDVCPTGALVPIAERTQIAMGVARVDERTCVSANGTGVCGACFTNCPLRGRAITLQLFNKPIVHAEHCVGCGLCEEACILKGVKAIRVFSQRGAVRA